MLPLRQTKQKALGAKERGVGVFIYLNFLTKGHACSLARTTRRRREKDQVNFWGHMAGCAATNKLYKQNDS